MRRRLVAVIAAAVLVAACGAAEGTVQGLRDRIESIDIGATLEGLRDCDRLAGTFVGVVQTAADTVDSLAERSDGRISETDLREAVDNIAVSRYFDIAKGIGCAELDQRIDTIDRLRDLNPDTPAGEDFLGEILRQVESQ